MQETFAYALMAAGEPVHTVAWPPEMIGWYRPTCDTKRGVVYCRKGLMGNTMPQVGWIGTPAATSDHA